MNQQTTTLSMHNDPCINFTRTVSFGEKAEMVQSRESDTNFLDFIPPKLKVLV